MKVIDIVRELASAWKDLVLLVLGIYLALWMESSVQDWQDDQRQRDYLYRLSIDLKSDAAQLQSLLKRLEAKQSTLQDGLTLFKQNQYSLATPESQQSLFLMAQAVMNYHFFTPQDFTFLSMRESGDFKLITRDDTKDMLLRIYDRYKLLNSLQENYIQGLDDYFIPFWLEHVDMFNGSISNPEKLGSPYFANLLLFALNETSNRHNQIERILTLVQDSARDIEILSGRKSQAESTVEHP